MTSEHGFPWIPVYAIAIWFVNDVTVFFERGSAVLHKAWFETDDKISVSVVTIKPSEIGSELLSEY